MKVSCRLYAPAILSRGKISRYPLERGLCGPQNRSGRGVEEKISYNCPRREINPSHPTNTLVSLLIDLPLVLYNCINC
jgi:hypothetical protein